ncbi:MAG: Eco47II family restriction endonuclease [Cyanobacteria bacterium P01_C01_bin.38]
MSYLPYISNNDLENAVQKVVDCIREVQAKPDTSLYKNVIDPFSAIFDSVVEGISFNDWLKREKTRQAQKTVQNAIGYFHQDIVGGIAGWQNLSSGQLIDVCNPQQKVIAELKNKHNTVKGSDKIVIYDNLSYALETQIYQGFTAYYVEIIPKKDKNNKIYNQPFTPSDNKTKTRRPANQNIIIIKGQHFYDMATGVSGALSMLFEVLPDVITKVAAVNQLSQAEKTRFRDLFSRAY